MHFQLSDAETSPKIIEVLNWLCYVIVIANVSIIILLVSLQSTTEYLSFCTSSMQ